MINIKGARIDGASVLLGAVLGLGVGAVSGWLLTRRTLDKQIAKEVAGVKSYYADKAAASSAGDGDNADTARVSAALGIRVDPENIRALTDAERALLAANKGDLPSLSLGFVQSERDEVDDDDIGPDEEDGSDEGPVLQSGVLRDTLVPYVVSRDEHLEEGLEFSKVTLTWYSGDGVLTDERDSPLNDISIAGENFFLKFGELSEDPSIVYIRNERMTLDMEIILKEASFSETVLGYGKPGG
jgi:hypothetical protein